MIKQLTTAEEGLIILEDAFGDDYIIRDAAIEELCATEGIALDWEINEEEIYNLIIDNEDNLHQMANVHSFLN